MRNFVDDQGLTRFAFGANWTRFLSIVDDARIAQAEKSLREYLKVNDLTGKCFIDVGCGSGLFSLAARKLGAEVYSFDYDLQSVECTRSLKKKYMPDDKSWTIEQGSVLDSEFTSSIGKFDVVYSWGVLHHTGSMQEAFCKIAPLVADGGKLFISIYNDQGLASKYWRFVKKCYVSNSILRVLMVLIHGPYLLGLRFLVRFATGRLSQDRGMSLWYDMIDWVGGYPFEVARPEEVFNFFASRGFSLVKLRTCGGRHGCNEFVFCKMEC